jgi:hypothetical protein
MNPRDDPRSGRARCRPAHIRGAVRPVSRQIYCFDSTARFLERRQWRDQLYRAAVCRPERRSVTGITRLPVCATALATSQSLPQSFALRPWWTAWPLILSAYPARFCYHRPRKRRPIWEEGDGMVHAENVDSGISNFQLDNRSGRDHHSLAHLSKFELSGVGAPARSHRAR